MYCQLITLYQNTESTKSPIVFIHGFPDSSLMYADYYTASEQEENWLDGRSIYAISFPNRHTNHNFPSFIDLITLKLKAEFTQILSDLIANSPTKKIIPIAHDLGATYTWRYIRQYGNDGIEQMVSLSVGSSFRYDVWEHGLFAFTWLYSLIYILPYYIPINALRQFLASMLKNTAGYQSESINDVYKDVFHYWYAPLWLIRFPVFFIPMKDYTAFTFSVLYMRSPLDKIASTSAFETTLQDREDCRIIILEDANHWFPEQESDRVLQEIRSFLGD